MRLVSYFYLLSLGSVLLACTSTASTTTTITRPELIQVSPDDFLGALQCANVDPDGGDGAGLVRSYVATLIDVTTASDGGPIAETGFALPSSPPTSCLFPVTFSFVIDDHAYRAEVDAYDRLPKTAGDTDPAHISAVSLGGRLQQDGTGATVAPRWTALCGDYPITDPDAGLGPDANGVMVGNESADAGDDADLPGVISYETLTETVHDCLGGLQPVK